jgi:hypothetical protein
MPEAANAKRAQVNAAPPGQAPNQPADPASRITELRVSAHLMTLETGLFCVFQTPASPAPDAASGLPGVRITPAPGIAGRPEAVTVTTFREDGWLNATAALVRVTDGSAQILVTIYQSAGMDAAPRLQVLRLSGEANVAATPDVPPTASASAQAAKPAAVAPQEAVVVNPEIMAHIQRMGDIGCKLGEWLGIKGSGQWVEGFGVAPVKGIIPDDIEYQAVLGRNWLSPWVASGKFCGSRGMALPVLGFKIRLKGPAAKAFECRYSATFVDGSTVGPLVAGEVCEAESLAALEAFQISVHPRTGKTALQKPEQTTKAPTKPKMAKPVTTKPAATKATTVKPATRKRAKS